LKGCVIDHGDTMGTAKGNALFCRRARRVAVVENI
jgi:hypothetical protein